MCLKPRNSVEHVESLDFLLKRRYVVPWLLLQKGSMTPILMVAPAVKTGNDHEHVSQNRGWQASMHFGSLLFSLKDCYQLLEKIRHTLCHGCASLSY
jgi:hypothetical protein